MSGGIVIVEGVVTDAANVGGFFEVFKNKVGNVLNFRTLKAGTGITITENTNDLEIESSAAGVNTFVLGFHDDGGLASGTEFEGWFSDDPTSTELHAQGFLTFAYTIKRGSVHVGTNSSNGTTDLVFRKNGADIASTLISVPASTTGSFDTGAISEAVAANDLTNLRTNRGGSSTFADYNYYVEVEK